MATQLASEVSETSVASQGDTQIFDIEMWRHAFSCANLKQLKGDFVDQHGYTDPNLSLWGILTALKQSTSRAYKSYYAPQKDNKTFVHVSVLFRTWATAICLYLPHIPENGILSLIVSPFLREDGSGTDNSPTTFDAQIVKLKTFYGLLHQCFKNPAKNLEIIFPTHTIVLFDGRQSDNTKKLVSYVVSVKNDVVTFIVSGTPLTVSVDTLPQDTIPQDTIPQINLVYLDRQKIKIKDLSHNFDYITASDNTMTNAPTIKYDEIKSKHYLESDCKKFLFWMSSCKNHIKKIAEGEVFLQLPNDYVEYIKLQSLPRLRVVCHSKILQALCKTLFQQDGINKLYTTESGLFYGTKKKKLISNNNMWGIKFNLYNIPADSEVYSLNSKPLNSKQITLFHGSAKPTTGDVASACEIGCDFGQNRGNDCENSMKGESKSGFFTRTSKFSLLQRGDQATAAGGKRKTRRIYKQKITRKQKAKKSRKSVRRISRR